MQGDSVEAPLALELLQRLDDFFTDTRLGWRVTGTGNGNNVQVRSWPRPMQAVCRFWWSDHIMTALHNHYGKLAIRLI